MSPICDAPQTIVVKISGGVIIFTSLMKASDIGFSDWPNAGKKCPIKTPSRMAIRTCT
jgi:hypothetical protein